MTRSRTTLFGLAVILLTVYFLQRTDKQLPPPESNTALDPAPPFEQKGEGTRPAVGPDTANASAEGNLNNTVRDLPKKSSERADSTQPPKKDRLLGDVMTQIFNDKFKVSEKELAMGLAKLGRSPEALFAAGLLADGKENKLRYLRESLAKQPSRLAYLALLVEEPLDTEALAGYRRLDPNNLAYDLLALAQQPGLSVSATSAALRASLAHKKLEFGALEERIQPVVQLMQAMDYGKEPAQVVAELLTTMGSELVISRAIGPIYTALSENPQGLPREETLASLDTVARYQAFRGSVLGRILETQSRVDQAQLKGDNSLFKEYDERERCLSRAAPMISVAYRDLSYEQAADFAQAFAREGELPALLKIDSFRYQMEDAGCLAVLERTVRNE